MLLISIFLNSSTDCTYSWCSSSSLSLSCPCSVGTALILSKAVEFPLAMSSERRLVALRWRRLSWVTDIMQDCVSLVGRSMQAKKRSCLYLCFAMYDRPRKHEFRRRRAVDNQPRTTKPPSRTTVDSVVCPVNTHCRLPVADNIVHKYYIVVMTNPAAGCNMISATCYASQE